MNRCSNKKGSALLLVLFIVMMITVLSLCYVNKSDNELVITKNLNARCRSESVIVAAMEHVRTVIENPQTRGWTGEYWTGVAGYKLESDSQDMYDVHVARQGTLSDAMNGFEVSIASYRYEGGVKSFEQRIKAELKLYPSFALICRGSWESSIGVDIRGDVWCGGNFTGNKVAGDLIVSGSSSDNSISGVVIAASNWDAVAGPGVTVDQFNSTYSYQSKTYSVEKITDSLITGKVLKESASNPAAIFYRDCDLQIGSNNYIPGFLVVRGKLEIVGSNNWFKANENYPAILTGGAICMNGLNASANIMGLAIASGGLELKQSGGNIRVYGGLAVGAAGLVAGPLITGNISIVSDPYRATVCYRNLADNIFLWKPFQYACYVNTER